MGLIGIFLLVISVGLVGLVGRSARLGASGVVVSMVFFAAETSNDLVIAVTVLGTVVLVIAIAARTTDLIVGGRTST